VAVSRSATDVRRGNRRQLVTNRLVEFGGDFNGGYVAVLGPTCRF
jgi:hypothetical protein